MSGQTRSWTSSALVNADPLRDVTAAQWARLQSITAHLAAAYMTTWQEDHQGLRRDTQTRCAGETRK